MNILVAELERERKKNVREKAKVESRNLREVVEGKVEELRKEVSVRPKNINEGGRSGNGIEQVRLNNIIVRREERNGNQCDWIKVKGGVLITVLIMFLILTCHIGKREAPMTYFRIDEQVI